MKPVIIVHGGAGREEPTQREPRRQGCLKAARSGWEVLERGGSALEAVETAVVRLEDDPHFNAGTGSCLTRDGRVEMDASIMDGSSLSAGAVGAIERTRNPIRVARAVMEATPHVLIVGPAALAFALDRGFEECEAASLIVERQRRRLRAEGNDLGTVGAIAVDSAGHLAAATSTGGVTGKYPGRVGDSAIIGGGTYADDRLGAASATGVGEPIMRIGLARLAVDLLTDGRPAEVACHQALDKLETRLDARAGLILVDRTGRVGIGWTTPDMSAAYQRGGSPEPVVATATDGEA